MASILRAHELDEMNETDLEARLREAKEELFNLRFQAATGQLDNPMRIKEVRHDVARMLTVLRSRSSEDDLRLAVEEADRGGEQDVSQHHPQIVCKPTEVLEADQECDDRRCNEGNRVEQEEMPVSHPLGDIRLEGHFSACGWSKRLV